MNYRFVRSTFALALILLVLLPAVSFACGPFSVETIFTFTVHPEYPIEKFAAGQIGVLQPTYARSYLYAAYRQLIGDGFSPQEQNALVGLWRDRLDFKWEANDEQWKKVWFTAREKVPGVGQSPTIDVYRHREKPNEYETYLNCQQDAFENAAATLAARIKRFGQDSALIKDWVAAQDLVFANCSEGSHIPGTTPGESEALARADRNYQIAAANFYAGSFDEAKTLFESISTDTDSPWRVTAPYLVARTLIRKASLGTPEGKEAALGEAEKDLNAILKNSALQASHESSRRLLNIVRIRLHPEAKLHELAHSLLATSDNKNLRQDLWDYTLLLDGFLGDEDSEKKTPAPTSLHNDDLTDWITTFQSDTPESLDHSLQEWEAKSALPWLVAALSKIEAHHAKARELMLAAARIKPESPAFAGVSFHLVRLMMQAERFDDARSKLDDLIANQRSRFNASSVNLLMSERMLLAESLDDFLTHAQRIPAAFSWNDDGREIPIEASELPEHEKTLEGKTFFDLDGAQILNKKLPLQLLRQAAESRVLPKHLRTDVAQAAWLRAVLLVDTSTADQLTPTLKQLVPGATLLLDDYLSQKQPDAKRFAAVYFWMKFPGLEPIVDAGVGRETPLGEQDQYRDNWWCSAAVLPEASANEQTEKKQKSEYFGIPQSTIPVFLTAPQRSTAEKEASALAAFGAAPNYICRQAVQWATNNPSDARVPEALHLAVKTTRYGCSDKQTGRWSKAAFDLLHKQYPNSVWAKRTPYWFKD